MYIGALGVAYDTRRPAWSQYSGVGPIDPYDIPDEILSLWVETEPGKPGYNAQSGCYCWGYRPKDQPVTLDGTHWASQRTKWKICAASCACPQVSCPTPPPCPTCPTGGDGPCPECLRCPTVVPIEHNKNWIWFAGAVFSIVTVYGVRMTLKMRKR